MADTPDKTLTLKIAGVDYPFPSFDTLTYKEAKRIKKETGLVMGQFFEALEKGDPDALMSVALIAKLRDNPAFVVEDLYDLLLTDIEIVVPDPEPEPVPAEEAADTPLAESSDASVSGNGGESSDESPSSDETPSPS